VPQGDAERNPDGDSDSETAANVFCPIGDHLLISFWQLRKAVRTKTKAVERLSSGGAGGYTQATPNKAS
jgi:hypothetical protein